MFKKLIIGAIALLLFLGGGLAVAGETQTSQPICEKGQSEKVNPASSENKSIEQKKAAIMKIMSQGTFKARIQDNKVFCSAFLEDFKQQKNIEYIQPIAEVDNYNDPKLQAYFKKCPNKAFDKTTVIYHARTLEEIAQEEQRLGRLLSEEELKEYGGFEYRATKNFKLYKVNIDNNAKNGDEYVFYAERYSKEESTDYDDGGYIIVDLDKCKTDGAVNTKDPFDYTKNIPLENYNGIIRYKGKYYVFDLYEDQVYWLSLNRYDKTRRNMNSVCRYRKHIK